MLRRLLGETVDLQHTKSATEDGRCLVRADPNSRSSRPL